MKKLVLDFLLIPVAATFAVYEGWSEPVLVADGVKYSEFDKPFITLELEENYVIIHRYWDGDSDVYLTKIDQAGNVLLGPKPVINTGVWEDLPICVIASDNTLYLFYIRFEGVTDNLWYAHISSDGDILEGPSLFAYTDTTGYSNHSWPSAVIEADNTIHLAYMVDYNGKDTLAYTRYNPDTEERLDIRGITISHHDVYYQNLNDNWEVEVDSEGNAHLFFDQTLEFEWMNPSVTEVCWAKVPHDSAGEYESKILSNFMVDNFDDGGIDATIDDSDIIHMVWGGYSITHVAVSITQWILMEMK
ncbi:MAG TPA: hypothetical protein VM054_10750 [bacterium]|nr:hypothetical protein [bacterium]